MPELMVNRRKSPRYSLMLIAEVTDTSTGARSTSRTADVSRTGCFIDMSAPLAKGTRVLVKLRQLDETFEVSGAVVYSSAGMGIGVMFDDPISEYLLAILDRWLSNAGAPLR